MRKTLEHKRTGVKLILDSSEIDERDPGNGTPVIVEYKGGTATYNYATCEGHVDGGRDGDIGIPPSALEWLESDEIDWEISAMYDAGPNGNW